MACQLFQDGRECPPRTICMGYFGVHVPCDEYGDIGPEWSEVFRLAQYANSKPYTERDIIELMVRAPACPEWFEPDIGEWKNPPGADWDGMHPLVRMSTMYKKAQMRQWPRAYAIMVLEAK